METLPVEILHRILDHLDTETILFSIRPTCRLFRAIVNTYDRYTFDFKNISKTNFHLFCRLIPSQNVTSLTLVGNEFMPNQICLFLSSIRLRQLTRLHSITFHGIDELQLDMILKRINLSLITSFSLTIKTYDNRRRKTTSHYISTILAQKHLHRLELDINDDRLLCPSTCYIKQLVINGKISFRKMYELLLCSPQLHTLILKQDLYSTVDDALMKSSFPQITSLIIERLNLENDEIERFLMSMPSLTYLKLMGSHFVTDGNHLEDFLHVNLLRLNKFEFLVNISRSHNDFEMILDSFRTPFWIEHKKWFVAGEIDSRSSFNILLYTIPICKSTLEYNPYVENIFVCTSPIFEYASQMVIENINELHLSLKTLGKSHFHDKVLERFNPLFPQITKLHIDFGSEFALSSIDLLHSIINISQLTEVKINKYYFNEKDRIPLCKLMEVLEKSPKLSSCLIYNRFCKYVMYPMLNDICTRIPRQIKHLQIPLNKLNQIEIILDRCPDLTFVQFDISRLKFSTEVNQWFADNTIGSSSSRHNGCSMIWIGQRKNESSLNHKRIKLTDEHYNLEL
ncbi:hypothetical protein I4U23_003454 [Adineta vaga]|nr:hypothetical protein I4U23_003454 [Adineta vaga]